MLRDVRIMLLGSIEVRKCPLLGLHFLKTNCSINIMPIEGCKMEIADNLSSTNFAASVHTGGGGCQPCWRVTHHQRLLFTGAWRAIFSFH